MILESLVFHRQTSFRVLQTCGETWLFHDQVSLTQWVLSWEDIKEWERPSRDDRKAMTTVSF
jgi:hypothetical protein